MKIIGGIAAAALLLLTACSGGNGKQATSSTVATPTTSTVKPKPTPKATPSLWTKAQAGRAYLRIVAPTNALLAQWGKVTKGDFATGHALAVKIVRGDDEFARALTRSPWPAFVKPQIAALASAELTERSQWQAVAAATTWNDLASASFGLTDPGAPKATAVRIALGLPSN